MNYETKEYGREWDNKQWKSGAVHALEDTHHVKNLGKVVTYTFRININEKLEDDNLSELMLTIK